MKTHTKIATGNSTIVVNFKYLGRYKVIIFNLCGF